MSGWQKDVNPYVQQNYYSNLSACLSSTFIDGKREKGRLDWLHRLTLTSLYAAPPIFREVLKFQVKSFDFEGGKYRGNYFCRIRA